MKSKIRRLLLIAVMGTLCCGCASESAGEIPGSGANEESAESQNMEGTDFDQLESYEEYSGSWTTEGVSNKRVLSDGGTVFSATIEGNNLQGSIYSVQWGTQRIAEIDDIAGVIESGVCRYEFQDDGWGDCGTLFIQFLEDRIEIEVKDFIMSDENSTGFAISGNYSLFRAAENDSDTAAPETDVSVTAVPNEAAADWESVYYERYYKIWDSERIMLAAIDSRLAYRENCSFYSEAVYYIEGGGGEYMMKTDISPLVEPLYPTDLVYIEEEDFKDYPPVLLHILKNEIYARHGYIFQNEDLNNYFRGMIWYKPQYEPAEFDVSVFNEIEKHNLDILARLDTY